ncbi:MAG: DUF2304 domain-containing protein [Bifidobacteriaceae bacterium]|jgi:hypothetical protein|nr:DUF2304 domain-containing protein [Bifidobacteriaceae bacterium]
MIIQALLIGAIVGIAVFLARGQGARHLAVRRLMTVAFALVAIASIIEPDAWSRVANAVGVGRGADLLLYILIVVFISYMATRFARERRVQDQITALARRIALDEAQPPDRREPEDDPAA